MFQSILSGFASAKTSYKLGRAGGLELSCVMLTKHEVQILSPAPEKKKKQHEAIVQSSRRNDRHTDTGAN